MAAVVAAMRSDLLAQGPRVAAFEQAFAENVGAQAAVACSSGTAALHLAMALHDVGPGDVCVVPAITFLATATAARFLGAEVVFADVDADTGLMTPETLADAIGRAPGPVKIVAPVHLGGRLCDMPALA
ncbi:MAG: aminotransferase class I/II-fold pyridoxal phosphate-dependent enzyme, partial [Caulobacteraceae bacterium]